MWYVEYMTDGGWKPMCDLRNPGQPILYLTHQQAEDAASNLPRHRIIFLDNELSFAV